LSFYRRFYARTMNARLIAFLLCLALALAAGCTTEAAEEPTPVLTASPAAAIFAPVEPTPTFGPAVPLVLPLAPAPHPAGTRTGEAKVDAVIAAFEAQDAAALAAQIAFYPVPCNDEAGIGALTCPAGMLPGTPIDVFGYGTCEGAWIRRGDPALPSVVPAYMTPPAGSGAFDARVYAVIQARPVADAPVPGDTMIIFNSGVVVTLGQDGLTYIAGACGANGRQWLEGQISHFGAQPYILPPLK
jgi:hypothetical protein